MNTDKLLKDLRESMEPHKTNAIAAKSGLTRQTVASIANGKCDNPTIGTLQKIYDAVNALNE